MTFLTERNNENNNERNSEHFIHGDACGTTHVYTTAFFPSFVSRRFAAHAAARPRRPHARRRACLRLT